MKPLAWLLVAACLPGGALAAIPYVYPFNAMTGQEVLDHRLKHVKTQLDYLNREKVDAYLNGIRDGAHGRDWCLATPLLPNELNANVVARMKAAYSPAALKGNAAPLVLAALREQFPCAGPVVAPRAKPDKVGKGAKGAARKKAARSHVGTQSGKRAGKQADRRKG
jgi:hypothetical protein